MSSQAKTAYVLNAEFLASEFCKMNLKGSIMKLLQPTFEKLVCYNIALKSKLRWKLSVTDKLNCRLKYDISLSLLPVSTDSNMLLDSGEILNP